MSKLNLKILYSESQISDAVAKLGKQITNHYGDREVVAVCILSGASIFFADLVRKIESSNLSFAFLTASSYKDNKSSGSVQIKFDSNHLVKGKEVLIVDGVIDSCLTINKVKEFIQSKGAKQVKIACLIDKDEQGMARSDFYGFIQNDSKFIVGYGMDDNQKWRNLPYIAEAE